jgi:hypothetical protein
MMDKNVFEGLKSVYGLAFENFKIVTEQQKNFVEMFLKNSQLPNSDAILKLYTEWLATTEKALDDFKDVVLKGLDYMSDNFKKTVK